MTHSTPQHPHLEPAIQSPTIPANPSRASTTLTDTPMRSSSNTVHSARERPLPRSARAGITTSPHCYPSTPTTPPRAAPMGLAKPSLMPIPPQRTPEPSTLKGMHPVRSYGSTRGVHPTPRQFPKMERSSLMPPQNTNPMHEQTREPNPGALRATRATPMPRIPPSDHPTREHITVGRGLNSTTATLAAQHTHRAHIASRTSHNSATTRPSSPISITTIAHTHTHTSLTRRPQPGQQRHRRGTQIATPGSKTTYPAAPTYIYIHSTHARLAPRRLAQEHSTQAGPTHPNPQRGHEFLMHRMAPAVSRGVREVLGPTPSDMGPQRTSGLEERHKLAF